MTTRNASNVVARALEVAHRDDDVNIDVVHATITAIANEWPWKQDESMLNLYLVHDCRSLAKTLMAIADAAEQWDNSDPKPSRPTPMDRAVTDGLRLGAGVHAQQARDNDTGGYGG